LVTGWNAGCKNTNTQKQNPPEKKPAVIETPEGDVIAIRRKMYLSLSYDHRVVDGSLGGNFLYFIKDYLENWKE